MKELILLIPMIRKPCRWQTRSYTSVLCGTIVPDFDGWKKAFDSDPVGREKSGVRRYQVLRSVDDPSYIMIDLEFDSKNEAEALLAAMREVWRRVEGTVMIESTSADRRDG